MDRRIDPLMAERVLVTPMVSGGDYKTAAPDPDRTAFEIDAIVTIGRHETDIGGNAQVLRNTQITTAPAEAQILHEKLAGRIVKKGDVMTRLATGKRYRIERLDRDHPGRLAVKLSIDGSAL